MLVLPSIREGWGLVITESANLGTPSLVYDVSGVVDAVKKGEAGFIADQINYLSLVEKIKNMTPESYAEIRENAFNYSLEFTWEQTANQFSDTVNGIIENRSKI
jgi:glycosyltransferase involved in cell wall biosynthesis